ncbi:hypothetical protein LSH36_309g02023 [Paralvinella palmiformis]|uniref:Sodium/hydrogen exchanger n=1 Tax=Paralvinella palmiformis TaxID=53620 RepID=A0AAD9JIX6_9ANNE|nr:hypothetical protein LSH36_309g02023 [Paralvinella palmiformis]
MDTDTEIDVKQEEVVVKSHWLDVLDLLMFVALLIIVVVNIWLFKHRRLRFIHETGLAIIYGLIVGALIMYASPVNEITSENVVLQGNSSFDPYDYPDIVKLFIPLPNTTKTKIFKYSNPVEQSQEEQQEKMLEEKKHFFNNFGAIMTFAFVGTTVSCLTCGAVTYGIMLLHPAIAMTLTDCMLFGAFISATDTVTILAIFSDLRVDMDLYALVFGESSLNDAVAIVLSETIEGYKSHKSGFDSFAVLRAVGNFATVLLGSFALGTLLACATALLTKFTAIRDHPLLETSLFLLMSYGAFLAAEAADLTGKHAMERGCIVATLFCGICQAHYTYNNLSDASKARTREFFQLLSFLSENVVFLYIGISTFTYSQHAMWDPVFIGAAYLGVIVGRLLNVYPLSFLLNLGRKKKIHFNFQHMLMFSGLRGAVSFALAIRNTGSDQLKIIFSTTLIIVITTVILFGGLTTQMLEWLKIRVGIDEDAEVENINRTLQVGNDHSLSHPSDRAWLVRVWSKVDSRYVKPLLTHARPPLTETLPECCNCLARILTTHQQLLQTDGLHLHQHQDSDLDLIIPDQEPGISNTAGGSTDITVTSSGDREVCLITAVLSITFVLRD